MRVAENPSHFCPCELFPHPALRLISPAPESGLTWDPLSRRTERERGRVHSAPCPRRPGGLHTRHWGDPAAAVSSKSRWTTTARWQRKGEPPGALSSQQRPQLCEGSLTELPRGMQPHGLRVWSKKLLAGFSHSTRLRRIKGPGFKPLRSGMVCCTDNWVMYLWGSQTSIHFTVSNVIC